MLRADLGQLGEDIELELGDLGDGLDDEVYIVELFDRGGRLEQSPGSISLLLGDALLGDILSQELLCCDRPERCLAHDADTGSRESGDGSSHEPAKARPLSRAACEESTSVTGMLAFWAATRAIPRPYGGGAKHMSAAVKFNSLIV